MPFHDLLDAGQAHPGASELGHRVQPLEQLVPVLRVEARAVVGDEAADLARAPGPAMASISSAVARSVTAVPVITSVPLVCAVPSAGAGAVPSAWCSCRKVTTASLATAARSGCFLVAGRLFEGMTCTRGPLAREL